MKPVYEKYGNQLVKEGIITENKIKTMENEYMEFFRKEHEIGK